MSYHENFFNTATHLITANRNIPWKTDNGKTVYGTQKRTRICFVSKTLGIPNMYFIAVIALETVKKQKK